MPFRSIDPAAAEQLATLQARRAASLRLAREGERLREAAGQSRLAIAPTPPVQSAEERVAERCSRRLDHSASNSLLVTIVLALLFLAGPVVAFGTLVHAVNRGPSWHHLALVVLALAISSSMVRTSTWRSKRRLAAFRSTLRASSFPIAGAEEALGYDGVIETMTVVITPVDDLPVDPVANLVALIDPEVRVGIGNLGTTVGRHALRGVSIIHTFKTYEGSEDGVRHQDDDAAPARWVNALVRKTLPALHDLHAISTVQFHAN